MAKTKEKTVFFRKEKELDEKHKIDKSYVASSKQLLAEQQIECSTREIDSMAKKC